MKETLKMLNTIKDIEVEKKSLEEIAKLYIDNPTSILFACGYRKISQYVQREITKRRTTDRSDIISLSFESLNYCLSNFDTEKNCKVITFFCCVFNNELNRLFAFNRQQKRNKGIEAESLEVLKQKGKEFAILIEDTLIVDDFVLNNKKLTKQEKEYCKMKIFGFGDAEISQIMQVSKQRVSKIKITLEEKITRQLYSKI